MIVIDYVIGVYTKMVRKLGIGNHNLVVKYYAALPPVKAFVKSKAVSGAQQERAHSPLQSFFRELEVYSMPRMSEEGLYEMFRCGQKVV